MALTDADRLQMTMLALMRYSVVTKGGGAAPVHELPLAIIAGYFVEIIYRAPTKIE